jgi:hypothetical protein
MASWPLYKELHAWDISEAFPVVFLVHDHHLLLLLQRK